MGKYAITHIFMGIYAKTQKHGMNEFLRGTFAPCQT